MSYVLATTERIIRWYSFDPNKELNDSNFTIIDKLDLNRVPQAPDKETAKLWAKAIGLKTWRYLKL